MIHAIAPAAIAYSAIDMATADAPRAVEEIDLHRERVQQMGQRQPDGADLLPSRRDAVEDSARDDEVAARVVVAEREAERVIVPRDERAAERGGNAPTASGEPRAGTV